MSTACRAPSHTSPTPTSRHRDTLLTRTMGRALLGLDVSDLISGQTEKLALYVADSVEMKLLHMVTADAARTPTLTLFARPDYFVTTGFTTCPTAPGGCVHED